ncbi:NAD(P)-dependent oxidoreductase [Hyphomicrobium sp.]|uniref:NAD(P)-dependent oxidoreductase n=1 Tax=Hyphomicrobium sp. TaxID=82 RepID=UPI000FB573FE|nr:NAD(P)-dependent oxidoreductase [Hyphomicrobium sp.]RUO99144.1 MAG: NAD(P)-dependent oxidoreductase [Hyphomicrobium sp.]
MARVAWLGLGVMGYPMAGHLKVRGGHEVVVYNRSPAKAEKWQKEFGGTVAATPAEAARGCDAVFSCVGNDDDLRSVTTGSDGAFQSMAAGSLFIDHTTASAKAARELAADAEQRGFHFLDCPVSGGQAGAENGVLTVMAGGEEAAFKKAEPLISCFARAVRLMGPSGSGQLAKMCNQIAIAGLVQGLAESIHFAECAGLDVTALIETISKGAAQSWQMENRWKTMHGRKFDFGFAVDWMRKDLAICFDEAASNGADLSVAKIVDGFYREVQSLGGSRWDTSSLIARLKPKT